MAEPTSPKSPATSPIVNVEQVVTDILATIEREREREIVSRRFGLFDRKETLEQIGELLGITRERVRQLEKAVVTKLKVAAGQSLPHIQDIQTAISSQLQQDGSVSRISDLSAKLTKDNSRTDQARVAFLTLLCPQLVVIDENDSYFHAVGLASAGNDKQLRSQIGKVIDAVKKIGAPTTIDKLAEAVGDKDQAHVAGLASVSKQLASLHGRWGLVKWPMVNPKNIRDKIYVILFEKGKPLHFNDISEAIKASSFKRKDVTTQAIHNELIKDGRFVLIGRGIYALKEWGYEKGTVADIITQVLKKSKEPLHRDEIVKRVLKSRHVKETTILLNLQGKAQFKRVAKATYDLAD
ncbi:MAG: sigma factor-like helix-turn-helix DNA-binding protein [Candidatus Saccharimonadales bacterium]